MDQGCQSRYRREGNELREIQRESVRAEVREHVGVERAEVLDKGRPARNNVMHL